MSGNAKVYSPEELASLHALVILALDYDPYTGIFVWKYRQDDFPGMTDHGRKIFNSNFAGKTAGSLEADGYVRIKLAGKKHQAHRLAWLVSHGYMSPELDHINQRRDDNRIANLRESTPTENSRNEGLRVNNTSGHAGVDWRRKSKKWRARIKANGRRINLGLFVSIEDAIAARNAANIKYGFSPLHGVSPSHPGNEYRRQRAASARRSGVSQ